MKHPRNYASVGDLCNAFTLRLHYSIAKEVMKQTINVFLYNV